MGTAMAAVLKEHNVYRDTPPLWLIVVSYSMTLSQARPWYTVLQIQRFTCVYVYSGDKHSTP